jgi:hypothetical protein
MGLCRCSPVEKSSATLLAKKRHRDEMRIKNRVERERMLERMASAQSADPIQSLLGAEAGYGLSEEDDFDMDVLPEELEEER